jgi:glutamate:Na+ symporter, ESS family
VKVEFNLLYTLLVAIVVLFAGRELVKRVAWLERFSVPSPVVGGCLIAIVLAAADGFANTRVSFDMTLKDPLLLIFFTTVGLAADARMLAKGGPRLFIFLLVATVFIVIQNAIGVAAARAMDLNAEGIKVSKDSALRGITIPMHPGTSRFFARARE